MKKKLNNLLSFLDSRKMYITDNEIIVSWLQM